MQREPISRRSLMCGAIALSCARQSVAQQAGVAPAMPARFDVERFVDDVRRARADADAQPAIEAVLRGALANPHGVLAGLGEPTQPGIHTLHRAGDLTILNVVWAPLMVLLPHNHNMWASIGIYSGREDNILWQRRGDRVTATGAASLSSKEVFSLPVDAIHSVVNPIRRMTGAIHIYGGDFFATGRSEWDAATLTERPWDLAAAREEFVEAADRFNAAH